MRSGCKFERHFSGVGNVYDPPIKDRDTVHIFPRERNRPAAPQRFSASGIRFGKRGGPQLVAVGEHNEDRSTGKELQPALNNGLEYRLGIGG